jgi:hypothetical protein
MVTVDLSRGIFSSRYFEPARFLSLFPEVIRSCNQHGGRANVLATRQTHGIAGFAYACRLPGAALRHVARLEFYVHDNFLSEARTLVRTTMLDAGRLNLGRLRCQVLDVDSLKRRTVKSLGAAYAATFVAAARINDEFHDVVVYEWDLNETSRTDRLSRSGAVIVSDAKNPSCGLEKPLIRRPDGSLRSP